MSRHSQILWNDLSTIARYRIFAISEHRKLLYKLDRNIGEFELESILIIMFCGLTAVEKKSDELQVIHIVQNMVSI